MNFQTIVIILILILCSFAFPTDSQTNLSNFKTNSNKLSNDLYKQYSDCVKTRYNAQHRTLHKFKRSPNDILEDGMRFKREKRSVLEGEGMRFKKDPILDEEGI